MPDIKEKLYSALTAKNTQGSQTLRALQWHADERPIDPPVSSNRCPPERGRQWVSCPGSSDIVALRLGWIYGLLNLLTKNPEVLERRWREWTCLRQDSQEHGEQHIHLRGLSRLRCWAHIPSFGALTTRLWAAQYHSVSIFSAGITPVCTNSAMCIETARDWLYNLSWGTQLRWAVASLQHLCCYG